MATQRFPAPPGHYRRAIRSWRLGHYNEAQHQFTVLTSRLHPSFELGFVSHAQMQRIVFKSMPRCRWVLRQGLRANPESPILVQAWGLHEMQRENHLLGIALLTLAVELDPSMEPVTRWKNHREFLDTFSPSHAELVAMAREALP